MEFLNSTSSSEEEIISESYFGMAAESRNLYREEHGLPWREVLPQYLTNNIKTISVRDKFALVVRRQRRIGDNDDSDLSLCSITVQRPVIRALLGPVFFDYNGINTNLKKLEFTAPFHEFFYRWTEFVQAKAKIKDEAEAAHFRLLFDIISVEITPHIEVVGGLVKNGVISFGHLWSLFSPGTEIYSRVDDQDRLYLLLFSRYTGMAAGIGLYILTCCYVETDGINFGFAPAFLNINAFDKFKPISELSALPSHLHPNIDEIRKTLHARGKKFEQLKVFHHVSYNGYYDLSEVPFGSSRKTFVQGGRVIVDCGVFARYNAVSCANLSPLTGTPMPANSVNMSPMIDIEDQKITALSPEHYVLCSPTVKGFCLGAKKWVSSEAYNVIVLLYIDSISEIEWNSDAFKHLVLPHDYKKVVHSFVEAQISQQDTFDDLIRGKGKGFIMLLSGEPETGKTLTAESVADTMERPLYSISAGELGNEAGEVERNLQRVLELSTKWGAVLLLDECDVFMVRRSSSHLHRNQLVSVFLRLLEYYEGVMFLTTNRIESFDPAFESRIHLTINYPKLDQNSRLHIWRTFIVILTKRRCKKFAEADLNGREIKNVVKTAGLLAAGDKASLRVDHIETVLRVKRGDRAYFGFDIQKMRTD
ncbi:hypothetical protein N8I77_009367 [Diaporthe amygdali]|uniref:AAA+ ATPase domain-containing protein n=1 Tax=Phomopsis amygdali TaxID=1214568 RepID=A0AAD9SAW3_PHOAM|nr:hypothetical protein N8I77_009367 [Diaporthe amygdali]